MLPEGDPFGSSDGLPRDAAFLAAAGWTTGAGPEVRHGRRRLRESNDLLGHNVVSEGQAERSADVTVVGVGGIGCAVGYALRAGGLDVTFVEADEEKLRWGSHHGLGLDRRPLLPARFLRFAEWDPPQEGVILLCTKCYNNESVLSRLGPSADVIPIQNGFDRALSDRCQIEGIASFVSQCTPGQTHTRITRRGSLHIGRRGLGDERPIPPTVRQIIELLDRHGPFRLKWVPNVLPFKYAKLMYNAAISPLAAVTGLDNGQLLTHGRARRLFFDFLRENYCILKAASISLGRVGPFHPDTVDRILRWPPVRGALAWPFSLTLRNTYCSMSGDIERGRTEIDHFNGHLIGLAGDRACDLNRRALTLVKKMEHQRSRPDLSWLDSLAH
jgi:2-dehydropantoate 2-reductase